MKTRCNIIVRFVLLFVLAGTAGGNAAKAEPPQARIDVKAVHGAASVSRNGADYLPLHAGDFVGPGSIVKTADNSTVDLFLPDSGTVLRMRPDSLLQFARLDKTPAGELSVSDTSLKLLKGSVIGSQRKLVAPSHFDIMTRRDTATIVGTEYVVNADGAVSVLDGTVRLNYNLPGHQGSVKVSVPAGYTFDPASGTVVPTSSSYLQNLIADVNTVKHNAQVFKAGGATIVVQPEQVVSPVRANNGVGNGQDPQPPGNPPINDGSGTSPGNPGNKGGAH
jgi:FecR protein